MDELRIYTAEELPQGSPEWFAARAGIPTASCFQAILAKGEGRTRAAYMRRLAGEVVTGEPGETFVSADMERGNAMEPEARRMYAFMHDCDPLEVGFCRRGYVGASPDSLIAEDGALEIKTKKPERLIDCILADKFPNEHVAQCQGVLWVTGRQWIDLCCYWPGLPLFVKRAERDEEYIARLEAEVRQFNIELTNMVTRIRAFDKSSEARMADVGELLRAG